MSTATASRPPHPISTPQTLPSALTPSGSSSTPRPGDSPERANKRARFNAPDASAGPASLGANGNGHGNGNGNGNGNAGTPKDGKGVGTPRTPGANTGSVGTANPTTTGAGQTQTQTGRKSNEDKVKEGMRWVKDKIGEMEVVYKVSVHLLLCHGALRDLRD